MPSIDAEFPFSAPIDPTSGLSAGLPEHYAKPFAAVADTYLEGAAGAPGRDYGPDSGPEIAYEVFSTARAAIPGALTVGTSILNPGRVGAEFAMTRGHLHEIVDRAEIYFGLSGHGVMLVEDLAGEVQALELTKGSLVYVPGGWIHRSVNVGTDPLVSLFCFSADAGQDYGIVERSRGMRKLVVSDGSGGWMLEDNPLYVARDPA